MGLIWAVVVHSAGIQDRDGAKLLLMKAKLSGVLRRLKKLWVDGGYAGKLIGWTKEHIGWILEVIKRTEKGFVILPKRWVVERTFGWFTWQRRLSKDYETLTSSSEAMIYIAMIQTMVRRLDSS